jgi:hypothetical protein
LQGGTVAAWGLVAVVKYAPSATTNPTTRMTAVADRLAIQALMGEP